MKKIVNTKLKSTSIAAILRRRISGKRMPSGSLLPSAHELAEQYHVCMMTANKALDILESESLIVRKKGIGNFVQKNILAGRRMMIGIAGETEYPHDLARNVLIGVFSKTAIACCSAENCDYRIVPYSDFLQKNSAAFSGLDGLLLSARYIDDDTADFIRSLNNLPTVIYQSEYEMDFSCTQVIPDHASAMNQLFSLAQQEQIDGIMIFSYNHPNGMSRSHAFEYYAEKNGFPKEKIQAISFSAAEMKQKFLQVIPQIKGKLVITCSDLMTCELIQLFQEHDLTAGKDYFLVSYDNLYKTMQLPPGIPAVTSIDYSRTAAAKTAVRCLIQLISSPQRISYQTIKYPTRLIIRETAFQQRRGF